MRLNVMVFATLSVVWLAGCSTPSEKLRAAEAAVQTFHAQLDQKDFDGIYNAATDDFQRAATKAEYDAFIRSVRQKLGRFARAERKGWNVMRFSGETRVVLSYAATFERGSAFEEFTFREANGGLKLVGFQIKSSVLDRP